MPLISCGVQHPNHRRLAKLESAVMSKEEASMRVSNLKLTTSPCREPFDDRFREIVGVRTVAGRYERPVKEFRRSGEPSPITSAATPN
jgi:hypothetical protein